MAKVEVLQRSLTAYKGHLTRASNDAEKLLDSRSQDNDDIQAVTLILENKWKRYDEAYNTLETALLTFTRQR